MKTLKEVLWKDPNENTKSDDINNPRLWVTCTEIQSCCRPMWYFCH